MAGSEKQRVALVSLAASAGLAAAKLAAALATGSLGILSEAIHGVLDFGATVITWFAVRWSDQPPDDDHHYGHAKAESVAALVATGLLFITTVWIVFEAVRRLWAGESHVEVTWWAAAIVAGSVLVDLNRSRALRATAEKTSSEALEADALHFSSDMWSSIVVLFGLAAAWAGYPAADPIAALAVAGFVGLAGWRLGKRTLNTLLDAAPAGATARIASIVTSEDGVIALKRLRLRPAGATLFTGVVVAVRRTLPIDDLVALKARIARRIEDAFPTADVTVTADPVALDDETIFERVMLIAQRQGQAIHHLTVQSLEDRKAVSFDLEVPGALALGEAHEVATRLETAIRGELGAGVEVESHIEPLPGREITGVEAPPASARPILAALKSLAASTPRLTDLHSIRVRSHADGLYVHYHCRFAPSDTVDTVHAAIDRIDHGLRDLHPAVRRVVAHAEPIGRKRHGL